MDVKDKIVQSSEIESTNRNKTYINKLPREKKNNYKFSTNIKSSSDTILTNSLNSGV